MKEISVRFGVGNHLAGTVTVCEPNGTVAVVMPSAGLLHRIGPHRLHVRLAREAAAKGIPSIRFDMPGIGDSLAAPGRESYETQTLKAMANAMDLLTAQTGATRFVVAGLCSGADTGFQAALTDERIVGLFLMEPPRLGSGTISRGLRVMRQLREYGLGFAFKRLLQLAAQGELFNASRSGSPDDRWVPPADEYIAGLRLLAQRGVHIRMAYAESSMGRYDLHRLRRDLLATPEARAAVRVESLPQADHLFTRVDSKITLGRQLMELLEAVQGASVRARRGIPEREAVTGTNSTLTSSSV